MLKYEELRNGMIVRGAYTNEILNAYTNEILKVKIVNKKITLTYSSDGKMYEINKNTTMLYELPHINPKFKIDDAVKFRDEEYRVDNVNGVLDRYRLVPISIRYVPLKYTFVSFEEEHLIEKVSDRTCDIDFTPKIDPDYINNIKINYHFEYTEENKMNTNLTRTKLTDAQEKFLPEDVQKLVELGVLDSKLQVTPPGSILLTNLQVKDDKTRKALIEMAEAIKKKDEEDEEDEDEDED